MSAALGLERDFVVDALPAYDIGDELGRGAWGIVVAGRHRRLGREVAIKYLPRAFGADRAIRERFLSEAQVVASLHHPHIVEVYDFVEYRGVCLLIMERLIGGTARERMRTDGITPRDACALALATCSALHYAHQQGLVHRDVKPDNLVFSRDSVLKVTDFGLARVMGAATVATQDGYLRGTPAYLAPEQALSGPVSPATDVYALGCVLFELLSGALPYPEADSVATAVSQRIHERHRSLLQMAPDAPASLSSVIETALESDPADRYQTAKEFASAIATAAARSWGDNWLGGTDLRVLGNDVAPTLPTEGSRRSLRLRAAKSAGPHGRTRRRPSLRRIGSAAVVLAAVVATSTWLYGRYVDGERANPTFTITPEVGAVGSPIRISARGPCPSTPPGWRDPGVHADLYDPRSVSTLNDGVIGGDDFPLAADRWWGGSIYVPAAASAGIDEVRVQCTAIDGGGGMRPYFAYRIVRYFTVTP